MVTIAKIFLVTLVLLLVADRGCWVAQQYSGFRLPRKHALPDPDPILAKKYGELIDWTAFNKVGDSFRQLRLLEEKVTQKIEGVTTNYKLALKNCPPSQDVRARLMPSNVELYHVNYRYDEQCRRMTTPSNPTAKKFILAFGDSYTFGQGLQEHETYPSQLARRRVDAAVYNYGIAGAGPNVLLDTLRKEPERLHRIPQHDGIVTYLFAESHMDRAFCRTSCLNSSKFILDYPYFEFDSNGEIKNLGTFAENRTLKNLLLWPLAHSAIRQFWDLDFPRWSEHHFDLFVALMSSLRKEVSAQKPLKDFVVIFMPYVSAQYSRPLKPRLEAAGFKVLDYSQIFTDQFFKGNQLIPFDHHPTGQYYSILADWLAKDLKL